LRNVFIKQGVDPTKILYSRIGLDTSHWLTPPSPKTETEGNLRISYIGQLAYHKGVHVLLEAFNRLVFSTRGAQLKIYGVLEAFPDYVKSLRKIAQGHPLIEFSGRFDNRRIAEILNQTDVLVVPSIWYENSPITIMEALTAGTPVVTTNLGGMPELVQHQVNGLLFKVGDVDDLATQLQRLVNEPALVNKLAANARPVRLIDDEIKQLISLYSRLVE
jgi:glycosyltransferase involved in cell wall biosynthesis